MQNPEGVTKFSQASNNNSSSSSAEDDAQLSSGNQNGGGGTGAQGASGTNNEHGGNNAPSKPKQKRRTRHDPNNRDFFCGCGRAYLSYPALYTHIKQKHDGTPPEGTAVPQDRGRSVQKAYKEGLAVSGTGSAAAAVAAAAAAGSAVGSAVTTASGTALAGHGQSVAKAQNGDDNMSSCSHAADGAQEQDVLDDLIAFLTTISVDARKTEDERSKPLLEFINENFPYTFFRNSNDYEQIKALLDKQVFEGSGSAGAGSVLAAHHHQQQSQAIAAGGGAPDQQHLYREDVDSTSTETKKTDLNRVFAHYLACAAKALCARVFREACVFACLYRKALNLHGWCAIGYDESAAFAQKEFCQNNSGEAALVISNELVIDYLPQLYADSDDGRVRELHILGPSEEQLKNAVYFIQNFSLWLYANRYSNAKLAIQAGDDDAA